MEVDSVTYSAEPTETEVIDQQAYNFVIQTVYEKCKKEKENKKLTFPLNANDIRVSYYTGVPLSYLERFYATEAVEEVEFPVNISERKKIYEYLKDQYEKSIVPTLEELIVTIPTQLSPNELQNMLRSMGFDYRKTKIGHLTIVENPDIAAQRFEYLSKITKFRKSKKTIYFVHEAYVSNKFQFLTVLPAAETSNKELAISYYFYYIVSKNGIVNVFFSQHKRQEKFEHWFISNIPGSLEPSSVIVILRPNEVIEAVTRYTSKKEIIKVLSRNGVPHRETMHKSQLYDLIVKFGLQDSRENAFEDQIKAHGHQILFLPRTLFDLTVGDLALNLLKDTVKVLPIDSAYQVKRKMLDFFDNISPTLWEIYNTNIKKLEQELYDIEVSTDSALEAIL